MISVSLVYKVDGIEVGYGEGETFYGAYIAALACCPCYPSEDLITEVITEKGEYYEY